MSGNDSSSMSGAEAPGPIGVGVGTHPDADTVRALWRAMVLTRSFDERLVGLYRQNRITGGVYSGIGNEASAVGTAWPLAEQDVVLPLHRDLGVHLVRGHSPRVLMMQWLKRADSQTGGKDTGLHLGAPGSNIVGMISHLGHMLPVAAGVAMAERYLGRSSVAVTWIGDGGTSTGDFHESLNFAAVHKLPMICVVENNQWAYGTPTGLQYACERLSDRAAGYGMAGETVDGTDVIAVWDAMTRAVDRARSGAGPTLLETVSFRMRGHAEHDDMSYMPQHQVDYWVKRDPVLRVERHVREVLGLDDVAVEEIWDEARNLVEDAVEFAEPLPRPRGPEAEEGVFARWEDRWTPPRS